MGSTKNALAIAVIFSALVTRAGAEVGVWNPIGPDRIDVRALVAAPSEPGLVYAASREATFFRSIDAGRNWSYAGSLGGPTRSGVHLLGPELVDDTLAIDAAVATTLYAALEAQIHRSVDGGMTWSLRSETLGARRVIQLIAVAGAPPALFASVSRTDDLSADLQRSIDGGASWTAVSLPDAVALPPFPLGAQSLIVAAADPRRLFVRTTQGTILEGNASASTWAPIPLPAPHGTLAFAPSTPATSYYSDSTGRVYRSTDDGQHWKPRGQWLVGSEFGAAVASQFVVDAEDPWVLYIVGGIAVPHGPRIGLYVSRDAGLSWNEAITFNDAGRIRKVVALRSPRSVVVIAGEKSFAEFSLRQGADFLPARGLQAVSITALAAPQRPSTMLYAGAPNGTIYTTNLPGSPWGHAEFGNEVVPLAIHDVDVDPQAPFTVWGTLGLLFVKSESASLNFVQIWPPCSYVTELELAPSDPRVLYAIGPEPQTGCCALQKSVDGGATWTCEHRPPLLGTGRAIAVDPLDPDRVYVADDQRRLARSVDGGASWELVADDLDVSALAVDPLRASTVYAGTVDQGLWRSGDRGATWFPVAASGLPAAPIADLAVHPVDASVLYASQVAGGVLFSRDQGATFAPLGTGLPANLVSGPLAIDSRLPSTIYAGTRGAGVWRVVDEHTAPCVEDEWTLCLGGGRFKAQARWRDFNGRFGPGHAVELTGDTGYFWFFSPDNLELMVKALDGRTVNDQFWVFYGALSNVEFELLVTDTATGETNAYFNPERAFASRGDTSAFPRPPSTAARSLGGPQRTVTETSFLPAPRTTTAAPCVVDDVTLCVRDGRFRVRVEWKDFRGRTGVGHAAALNQTTGTFWFFNPANLELAVKVLDGRAINGHFWVFYGALSNVEYRITVEDMVTGAVRTYDNPLHQFASRGDTEAFSDP